MRSVIALLFLVSAASAQQTGFGQGNAQTGQTQTQSQAATPIEKPKPATMSGQVISVNGEPVRRAEVTARRIDAGAVAGGGGPMMGPGAARVATDPSGMFKFTELDPGRYLVSVDKSGYVRQAYGATHPGRMAGSPITLSAGQELNDVVIKMTPHGVVTGKVIDEFGDPVGGIGVQALQQRYFRSRRQWMPVERAEVNDLGEFRIPGLAPGRYVISVSPQRMGFARPGAAVPATGDQNYVTTYYPGTSDFTQAAPVQVTSGGETRNIDFQLKKERTYRIDGKIMDGVTGKPAQNTMVMLFGEGQDAMGFMGRNMSRVRNNDGTFEIAGVSPGTYTLMAGRMGRNREGGSAREQITVGDRNLTGVRLNLEAGFTVKGSVKTEGPTELTTSGIRVFLQPEEGIPFGGRGAGEVQDDGTFELDDVVQGKYTVTVAPLTNAYVKTIRVANRNLPDHTVDLTAGPAPFEVVLSTAGATVQGVIQDSKKRATQGVTVVLVPEASLRNRDDLFKNTTSDANGAFTFQAVPPGEYKVFAWEDVEDYGWFDPAILSRYENDGKSLTLKENGTESVTMSFIPPEGGSQLEREADEREKASTTN